MNWRSTLSDEEAREIYQDACAAYQADIINDHEFRQTLAKLGFNATEIRDAEKFYRPSPPESEDNS